MVRRPASSARQVRANERAQALGYKNDYERRKYKKQLKEAAPDVVRFNRLDTNRPKFNLTKDVADRLLHRDVEKGEGPTTDLATQIIDNLNIDPQTRDADNVIRSVFDWVYYSVVTF